MSDIQRYFDASLSCGLEKEPEGEYVKYEDHQKIVKRYREALERFTNNSSIQANYPTECEQAEEALEG